MLDKVLSRTSAVVKREYTLSFDTEKIEFEIAAGDKFQGAFRVVTDDKGKPEGYVTCSDLRMDIYTTEFGGLTREILFSYDATGLREGSVQTGTISIVSNLGEYELPYEAKVTSSILTCPLGEVRNLFHFANLAQTNWDEAVSLFYSPYFIDILSGNDAQYVNYYRGLAVPYIDEEGNEYLNDNNVDRFLELTKKKTHIKYSVDTTSIELKNIHQTELKTFLVKKDGWGYVNADIYTDSEFIILEKEALYNKDFVDDSVVVPFYVEYEGLHRGKNIGHIYVEDSFQKITIDVKVNMFNVNHHKESNAFRRDNMRLTSLFIAYRLGQINKNEWVKESGVTVTRMLSIKSDYVPARLFQVHLMINRKQEKDAKGYLEIAKSFLNEDTPTELIAYSLYLEYLLAKESDEKREFANSIELLYVQNKSNFRLAWLLLYVKEEIQKDDKERWRLLNYQFECGNNSPIIYIEAFYCMLHTPSIISTLGDFEIAVLYFAKKYKALTADIRSRIAFLAEKEITFNPYILELLTYSYEIEPKDEVLEQICVMLMKGNCIGKDYFSWYEKAVEKELRINKLYEYYLMSIDLEYNGRLPKIVLMYFAYRSELDFERNAFLYANVLRHKPAYQDIYNDYQPAIKEFANMCINEGRINDDLAYIYKTVLGKKLYDDEYVKNYSQMLFMHKITVNMDEADSVIIVNEHLVDEQKYAIYNHEAVIPVVGEKYAVIIEDIYGNRFADSSLYTIKRIIKTENNMEAVMQSVGNELYAALYLAEKTEEKGTITPDNENALLYISSCDEVTDVYQKNLMILLAQYYFDIDEIAKLDDFMLRFDPEVLDIEKREMCIHIMVARGMYERAIDWVRNYGPEYIDHKVLVRLCDRILMRTDYEYEPELLKICEKIFVDGRYDESILKYLLMYKQGTTMSLKRLWRAADSFGLDSHGILESMIVQILYSGTEVGEESNIFLEYVAGGGLLEIEKIFLDKLSYDYFALDKNIDPKVFDRVIYLHQMGEALTDYEQIAFLKSCNHLIQAEKQLTAEQKALIVMFIKDFSARQMFFPFFLSFRKMWPKLTLYEDKSFVEYKGDEDSRVIIHYAYESGDQKSTEYFKEEMPHLIGGVFVKQFILFYGERIRYYITEESSRSEKLTQASILECKDNPDFDKNFRYAVINSIAKSHIERRFGDSSRLSEDFIRKCFLADKLFIPDRSDI